MTNLIEIYDYISSDEGLYSDKLKTAIKTLRGFDMDEDVLWGFYDILVIASEVSLGGYVDEDTVNNDLRKLSEIYR